MGACYIIKNLLLAKYINTWIKPGHDSIMNQKWCCVGEKRQRHWGTSTKWETEATDHDVKEGGIILILFLSCRANPAHHKMLQRLLMGSLSLSPSWSGLNMGNPSSHLSEPHSSCCPLDFWVKFTVSLCFLPATSTLCICVSVVNSLLLFFFFNFL